MMEMNLAVIYANVDIVEEIIVQTQNCKRGFQKVKETNYVKQIERQIIQKNQ